jgi:hypothetical protein
LGGEEGVQAINGLADKLYLAEQEIYDFTDFSGTGLATIELKQLSARTPCVLHGHCMFIFLQEKKILGQN